MSWFSNKKNEPSVDDLDKKVFWPFNKYPDWLFEVISGYAKEDFDKEYSDEPRTGWKRFALGATLSWETASNSWRHRFRERVVLGVFPAIVKDLNKPRWDVRWIEEYMDYNER